MTNSAHVEALVRCGRELIDSATASAWRGPDPYDGLFYAWPDMIRAGIRRRQLIVQLHTRSPIDLRRIYRRRDHPRIPKALGLFSEAALKLGAIDRDPALREGAYEALALLLDDHSAGHAWGYPFDVQTRWSYYPAHAPNVVVTAFAGCALTRGAAEFADHRFTARASEAAQWVVDRSFNDESGTFSYHEHSDTVIHNANLLGAKLVWLLLRSDPTAREAVKRAVERTLEAQASDGTWNYGEGPGLDWNDSFHTGFVLSALVELADVDTAVGGALARGAKAYAETFFGSHGQAWLWPNRQFPEDAHAAGTGLSTLAKLSKLGLIDPDLLRRVAQRVVTSTVVDGHAVWRRNRWTTRHIPYIRWCDAHVACGIVDAVLVLVDADGADLQMHSTVDTLPNISPAVRRARSARND